MAFEEFKKNIYKTELTNEELAELIKQGIDVNYNIGRLVNNNIGVLVYRFAQESKKCTDKQDKDVIESEILIDVWTTAQNYDSSKGKYITFLTNTLAKRYAVRYVNCYKYNFNAANTAGMVLKIKEAAETDKDFYNRTIEEQQEIVGSKDKDKTRFKTALRKAKNLTGFVALDETTTFESGEKSTVAEVIGDDDAELKNIELWETVKKAIKNFKKDEKEIFMLRAKGLSYKDIEKIMHLGSTTSRVKLNRALKKNNLSFTTLKKLFYA